jgi:glucose/arabinose dehydrogenase
MRLRALPLLLLAVAAGGCESTQAKSARLERQAGKISKNAKGMTVTKRSKDVRVAGTSVLTDANGTAAVVELRNTSGRALVEVPVAISVRDRGKHVVYANDAAGLDDALIHAPFLPAHGRLDWVHDQVAAAGRPASVRARIGADARPAPSSPPKLELAGTKLVSDSSGVAAVGTVANRSEVAQQRLVIYGVARRHGKVVAAGRAIVPQLPPGKTSKFSVFFIGDPRGARLSLAAPPTTFRH